ncbi:microsomal glutathione S-transferase 1-like [Liolophura sinensis]|uniref:microsomal glutathione S-transferase 1-like n=1 Tax=Liolophura sinensis TaxID=3198878 RepID=UPI003158F7E4
MAVASDLFNDKLFRQLAFYTVVVFVKMTVVQMATTFYRLTKHIYANEEDVKGFVGDKKDVAVVTNDVDVERVRRCHQNDLENVIPFIILGIFYVCSGPNPFLAAMLFRVFAASRIFYTVAYLAPLPQPSRTLMFMIGLGVNVFMAVNIFFSSSF